MPITLLLTLLALTVCTPVPAAGLNTAFVNAGVDSGEGSSIDGYLSLGLTGQLSVNAALSRVENDDATLAFATRQRQLGIAAGYTQADTSRLSWSLGYRDWGKEQAIETRDLLLGIGYASAQLSLSLGYETGELELFLDPALPLMTRSVTSERSAWRVAGELLFDRGAAWLSLLERSYEKNLPAIDQRRRLQRALNRIALSEAYALSESEVALGVEWYTATMDFGLDASRITSVLDNSRDEYLGGLWRIYIDEAMLVNFRISRELGDGLTTFTAGIGYAW